VLAPPRLNVRNPFRTYRVAIRDARLDDVRGPELEMRSRGRVRVWVGEPLYSTYRRRAHVTASFRQFMQEFEALQR
ncbi:MAG TPA: hypothetical protein VFZ68_05285, partial [Acidimicrobiales bacterium]